MDALTREFLIESQEGLDRMERCLTDLKAKPKVGNFCRASLCTSPLPFAMSERFDVIFLRNVMLYFSMETRRALMANAHRLLAPDGMLFLGSSEQLADPSLWNPVLAGGTCHFLPRHPS